MLINQFGIDQGVFTANANNYSVSGWDELLYYELEEGRPLVFAGQSTGGGHAFVVDGYEVRDGNGYFHVNWGWGGSCNGYYKISLLNPDESGTGGSTTSDGYSFQQQAIIGLQPAKGATVNYGRYLYGFEWDITIDEQPHTLMGLNTSYKPAVFDVALAERQADGTADYSHLYGMQTLEVEGYSYVGLNSEAKTGLVKFTIPDGVADDLTPGSHQLVFVHKEAGTDAPWQPVYGPNSSVEFIIGDDGQPADTLFHPLPQLTSSSRTFKVEGLKQRGLCQKINAIVQNNGDDYIGTLTCSTYYVEGNELKGLAYLSNTGLMIEAGETTDVNFTVAPITTGQFVVVITRGQEDLTGIKLTDVKKAKNYINHKSFSIGELTFYCQSAAYNERTDEEGLPAYYLDLSVNNGTTLDYDAAIVANIYQGNYESVLFNGSPNVYAWLQVGAKSQQSVSIRLPEALEPDEYYVQLLIANDFYSLMHKDYFVFASGFITVTSKAGIGTIDEGLDTDGLSGNHEKAAIHDLFGRKVQNPQKGIYIRNGKKHLVR
jgi:hypothetical protein